MKSFKRTLSIVLTMAMLFGMMLPMASAASSISNFKRVNAYQNGLFSDVGDGVWYEDGVKNSYELDLMTGVSDNLFHPNDNITLAQAVVMAVRLHCIYNNVAQKFGRNGGAWYSGYVDFAKKNGILTQDYTDYNKAATRAEFAAILAHAFPESALEAINTIPDGEISDVTATDAYAKEIYQLYRAGILSGSADSREFRPADSIRRAEAASVVSRMALPGRRIQLLRATVPASSDEESEELILMLFWTSGFNMSDLSDKDTDRIAAYLGDVDRLYKEYADNDKIKFISFNVGDSIETLQKFIEKYSEQYHYTLPVDVQNGEELLNSMGVDFVPCLVFVNEKGQARSSFLPGILGYDDLKAIMGELLGD